MGERRNLPEVANGSLPLLVGDGRRTQVEWECEVFVKLHPHTLPIVQRQKQNGNPLAMILPRIRYFRSNQRPRRKFPYRLSGLAAMLS